MADAVDVAVVGAGLSGSTAARALARAGCSVLLLEARDRVGGRTWSAELGGETVDLGAHYVGPRQLRIHALLRELGLATEPTPWRGLKVLEFCGRHTTYRGEIPKLSPLSLVQLQIAISLFDRASRRVSAAEPWTSPGAARLDATSVAAWFARRAFGREARAFLNHTFRMTFGVEASEMSLLHGLAWVASAGGFAQVTSMKGGSIQDGIAGGAQALALGLVAGLGERLVLSAPVRRVAQDAEGVTLESDAGRWRARRAILALPPPLAARIAFEPALPALRAGLLQRFPMGAAIKCLVLYERPFWRARGFSGEAVGDRGPVGYVLDGTHGEGGPGMLVAFVEGVTARVWSARPAGERRRAVLADLARFFGPEAEAPTHYLDQDWCAEPFTLGCSAGVLPAGVLAQFGPALREPVGRLHWAGTEAASDWFGFMEGALESGERAAGEVLARL